MKPSEIVRQMAAAGAPLEAITIALEAIEAAHAGADALRAADDERKAKRAAAKRDERARVRDTDATVARQSSDTDATVASEPLPDKESFPQTPFKEINQPRVSVTRARRKSDFVRLPDDWKPERFGDGTDARAAIDRRGQAWAKGELEAFRNWAANAEDKNGKGKKREWQAAFANWVARRDKEQGNGGHRNGSGSRVSVDPFTKLLNDRANGETDYSDAGDD